MSLPTFETFNLYALLMDIGYASFFLFLGQILRKKVRLLQELYLPAALIGGMLGMLCGPNFFNLIPFSSQATNYPNILVIALIASSALGYRGEKGGIIKTISGVRDSWFKFGSGNALQYGLFIIIGYALSKVFTYVDPRIGYLLPAGFSGGHGNAATVGNILEEYGYEGATGIGVTFATVGLLAGIIGGIIMINIASRKGCTKFMNGPATITEAQKTGWIRNEEDRKSIAKGTMDPSSIDPMTWHIVILGLVSALGYCMNIWFKKWTGIGIPAMCWGIIFAYAFQGICNMIGVGHYIDRQSVTRLSGICTDFLVFFGFLGIRKDVLAENWLVIIILIVLGIAWCLFELWVLCPMMFNSNWFERGIFEYGMYTGVVATGVILLRIVDPENKSNALEDYATAYIGLTWQSSIIIGICAPLAAQGHVLAVGIGILISGIAMMLLAIPCKSIRKFSPKLWNATYFEETVAAENK